MSFLLMGSSSIRRGISTGCRTCERRVLVRLRSLSSLVPSRHRSRVVRRLVLVLIVRCGKLA